MEVKSNRKLKAKEYSNEEEKSFANMIKNNAIDQERKEM